MSEPVLKKRRQSHPERDSSLLHHPLNPYRDNPPDYKALAQQCPDGLGKFLSHDGSGVINFTDARAVAELNKALLQVDMGLFVEFHEKRLCPPVPNRLNYLCWLAELLQLRGVDEKQESTGAARAAHVLDIGVGASCIYPLLGAHMYGWTVSGVEIDEESLACARRNVAANPSVSPRIRLVHVPHSADAMQKLIVKVFSQCAENSHHRTASKCGGSEESGPAERLSSEVHKRFDRAGVPKELGPLAHALRALGLSENPKISAVLTNPPFYSEDEIIERNPRTICTGSSLEMATIGGEMAFVGAIIADSLLLRDKITWYTATLGKKSSLNPLLILLSGLGIKNVRTVRFMGGVTTRWAIAWSFTNKGEHVLPGAGRSADPKIIDIASLEKRLLVSSYFDVLYDEVLETTLSAESKPDAGLSVVEVLSTRVQIAFACLRRSDNTWSYSIDSQQLSPTRCSVNVGAKSSSSPASVQDLDICVSIGVTAKGQLVNVEFDCTCASVAFVEHARHTSDIIKMEVERSNRKWRRRIAQDKEDLSQRSAGS